MKVLVTGSNGYVGSNFIYKYKDKYNFQTFSLFKQDIKNINFNDIDVVLHCAALVHQKKDLPVEMYHEINSNYPLKLAKLAKQNGVKQFIFISSIAVYGDDEVLLTENTTCNPITSYGQSKLEAEKQLLSLIEPSGNKMIDFNVSIIRPPMIYGKNAPGNIASLIQLIKKVPIIPLGGIENKRSFIYIENLCYSIDVLIDKEKSGVFLVSDDKSLSTSHLIKLLAENLNKKVFLIKLPLFEGLLKIIKRSFYKRLYENLEIDNCLTKKRLNLKNPFTVEQAIKKMFQGDNS